MDIKIEYISRKNPNRFGFEVVRKEIDQNNTKKVNYKRVFHTSSKQQNEVALKQFVEKGVCDILAETNWIPMVLILNQKHSTPKYIVRSEEELFSLSLEIVKKRMEERYYTDLFESSSPVLGEVSQAEIDAITNEKIKALAIKEREKLIKQQREFKESIRLRVLLTKIIEEKDLKSAFDFLQERSHYTFEYEGIDLERFQNTPNYE